jgi:maltose O-acetyltransferase
VIGWLWSIASRLKARLDDARLQRRWSHLRELGMEIGRDVWLPASTWIDADHCYLISIGDHCGFGGECVILAHDAQMDEFLDATRIGRVAIRESCHIGARTVILPGVEIGPRTIVGAGSVVSRTLPPDTVCAGSPARVLCSLGDYLEKHRARLRTVPTFPYDRYDIRALDAVGRAAIVSATAKTDCYITGGRTAELQGRGGTPRTPA